MAVGSLAYAEYMRTYIRPVWMTPSPTSQPQSGARPAHRAEVGEGQQQRDADEDLDEGDEVRAYAGDALGDEGGEAVEERGEECLADAEEVRAVAAGEVRRA